MSYEKIRVQCRDCGGEFLPRGLGPHQGRAHSHRDAPLGYIRERLKDLSYAELSRIVDFIQHLDVEDDTVTERWVPTPGATEENAV